MPAPATRRRRFAAQSRSTLIGRPSRPSPARSEASLVARIDAWPPNKDETLAFFVSGRPLGALLHQVLQERGGAPLHFLLAHLASLVSPGLASLRLVSVACAVASVPAIAALVGRLAGRRVALVATILVATSWMLLFHGVFGRMYALFLLTATLSFLALLGALERGDRLHWAAWVIATLAVVASHPFGAFVLATQAVFMLGSVAPGAGLAARCRPVAPRGRGSGNAVVAGLCATVRALSVGSGRGSRRTGTDRAGEVRSPSPRRLLGWLDSRLPARPGRRGARSRRARPDATPRRRAGGDRGTPCSARPRRRTSLRHHPGGTRHLIFALPFFAMLVAAGLLKAAPPRALAVTLAALVSAQLAWAWSVTPALFAGENPVRRGSSRCRRLARRPGTPRRRPLCVRPPLSRRLGARRPLRERDARPPHRPRPHELDARRRRRGARARRLGSRREQP